MLSFLYRTFLVVDMVKESQKTGENAENPLKNWSYLM